MFLFTLISSTIIILFFVAGYFITTIYLFSDEIKKNNFWNNIVNIIFFIGIIY